jgi:hypothetical protein
MFAEAAKAEKSGVRSTHSGRRLAKSIQREALDSVATALADYIAGQSPSETGNMAVAIDSAHPLHGAVRGLEASYGGVLPAEILPKWRLLLRQSRTDDEDADTTAAEILGWINKERSRMNGGTKGEASATTREKRFKIALSFPGERREFVREVADTLRSQLGDGTVLYDEYFEAEFARPGLDTYLQQLYRYESELIVVFVCAEYDEKQWCGLEWRAIRDLIKAGELERIMPVRFDSTEIPGLFSNDGYIWIGDRAGLQIADLIIQRLQVNQRGPAVSQSESIGDRTRRIAKIIDDLPGVVLKAFRDSDAQARVGVLKNLALETAVELAPVVGWLERRRPAETVELFKHRVFGVLDEAVACVAIEIPEYAGGEINRVEGCGNSAGLKKVGTLVVFKALVADSLRAWASEIDQG